MAVAVPVILQEQSSVKVVVEFKDPEDPETNITPATATWTLTDLDGTVINSREDVSITPAAEMTIFLSGDDLQILVDTNRIENRHLAVEGTYNNGESTIPIKQEFWFKVENLQVTS